MTKGDLILSADLPKVQKFLVKALKPGRQILDFVAYKDGRIEESTVEASAAPAVRGASVAKPELGCPEPRLARAELRAREVLFAFLNTDQQEDFEWRNAFVTEGVGTGHHYMVTSRHARDVLAQTRRQLYDLDEGRPYCVHDNAVPAAEEMLALHLLLKSPEHERYLRHLE